MTHLPTDLDWSACALFLDFDGTLAPIVERPEDAAMSDRTRSAVERLTDLTAGAVAVLSGRALSDLSCRLHPLDSPAAGSHGAEFRGIEGLIATSDGGPDPLQRPTEALTRLAGTYGLLVESKPGAVTIHYRSQPVLAKVCQAEVNAIADADPALRALHGHMVSEVALAGIDKGTALRRFMAEEQFLGRVPVMVGDDVTDEDAIRAAQDLGGIGIRIGPGQSDAKYRADDIGAFLSWLEHASMKADRT